ncbi:hypothetical protein OQA88_12802 [Cercophora sp. LCS_1]
MDAPPEDDYSDTPLQHLRPFGSGLHKKKIAFVPASNLDATSTLTAPNNKPEDISQIYLNLVLPSGPQKPKPPPASPSQPQICEICNLPLSPLPPNAPETKSDTKPDTTITSHTHTHTHSQTIAHQLSLPHSHPPSALDRSRMGLSYLSTHGWDPDSRKGLGSLQQGIQYPIKAKAKNDTLGIGITIPKNLPPPKPKERLLDAGKVRKQAERERRKAERLRKELFGRGDDLEKYLGGGAGEWE